MLIEVKVPVLPESVADATIATWHKKIGEAVTRDENIVDLETDKVVLEVPAPADGVLKEICFKTGDTVTASQILAKIDTSAKNVSTTTEKTEIGNTAVVSGQENSVSTGPAVRRMLSENNLSSSTVPVTNSSGRLTKEDVISFIESNRGASDAGAVSTVHAKATTVSQADTVNGYREEKRVPMTRLRAKIAERLVQSQQNAAILTTFNEVNLKAVMDLRAQYKDIFEKKYGIKLGFMSFFTKAVIEALKRFPAVNASIDGSDIVYHGYFDIGIAVSTERGLVVPILRNAEQQSMADIEKSIQDFAVRARNGKLAIEEMQGGTFTITNGGIFGSLLATPIINPPQAGILGMHKIQERPVVENGQIVIRPMMYIALSYDHRLIDGRESVQFLVTVKEMLEDPTRLLLGV